MSVLRFLRHLFIFASFLAWRGTFIVLHVELDYIFSWKTKVYLIFTQVRANGWGTNYNDPGKERSLCIAQSCKVGHHQHQHHRHHHRHRHHHQLGLNVNIAFVSGLQTQISLFLGRTRVRTSLIKRQKKNPHFLFVAGQYATLSKGCKTLQNDDFYWNSTMVPV